MSHEVFISYSKTDKLVADVLCGRLEGAGIPCWIAPRDVPPGSEWAAAIMHGIAMCRIMVMVYSANSNQSPQVRREVKIAFDKSLIVIPFRLEDVPMHSSLEYFCGSVHWLDALTPPLEKHIGALVEQAKAILEPELKQRDESRARIQAATIKTENDDQDSRISSSAPPDLTGEWEGEWRRDGGSISHRGRFALSQTGTRLTARMRVTFEKRGQLTILTEELRGLVTLPKVILQGEATEYETRGLSTSYLLDHFELQLENNGNLLVGIFYSRKGPGRASFKRIKAI
jgi:hypothetical protein